MEAIVYRIEHQSRRDLFKLFLLGDIHSGTIYCAEKKIKQQVQVIKDDPFARWIGMGDYADLILPRDPRWEWGIVADWVKPSNIVEDQCRWVEDLFKPIVDKCVGLLGGNHEEQVPKYYSYDFMYNLTQRLGVPYLGYSCFVRFAFARITGASFDVHSFKGHFTHGSGAPQTEGGKRMNLKKSMDDFADCDIYATAHIHDLLVAEKPYLTINLADPPRIVDKHRCGAITGSWFETYKQGVRPSYAEKKRYSPTPIGCPVFLIDPSRDQMSVFSNTNMMLRRLADVLGEKGE